MARPIQLALEKGDTPPPAESFPSAAVQVRFDTADLWMPGTTDNALIAPERCTWLVSVQAPYVPRSAPDPSIQAEYDSFTVMFDSASGAYLGMSAGAGSPDMISGRTPSAED